MSFYWFNIGRIRYSCGKHESWAMPIHNCYAHGEYLAGYYYQRWIETGYPMSDLDKSWMEYVTKGRMPI